MRSAAVAFLEVTSLVRPWPAVHVRGFGEEDAHILTC